VVVTFHGRARGAGAAGLLPPTRSCSWTPASSWSSPNVRGSDGYGKKWLHSDDGPKRLEVITDIEDAAKYIRANWKVGKVWGLRRQPTAATRRWWR